MSNFVRDDKYFGQGKFRVYSDLPRTHILDLICDADDKPFYRQYSYFDKCFNCSYFRSLDSFNDFCSLRFFTCHYNDSICEDFKPIKYSWFYNDFKKE